MSPKEQPASIGGGREPPSRRPSWIQRQSISTAVDPSAWPPHNPELEYDWSRPTHEFYKDDQKEKQPINLAPTFATARQRLDYSYHNYLIMTRQLLQDAILRRVEQESSAEEKEDDDDDNNNNKQANKSPCSQKRPWIVFTAGPMGVGKGYALTQLNQQGLFRLDEFVKIDPDMLKNELPEMAGFLQADRASAASKLHRESTQMADVLLEHALAHQIPVLVDGSLRDVEYYQRLFQRIRDECPSYRIAILHVTASEQVIAERAEKRAAKTGRVVPTELLQESIRQVPDSVHRLAPQADAVHTIANNEQQPLELVSSHTQIQQNGWNNDSGSDNATAEKAPTWEDFRRSWLDGEATKEKAKQEDVTEEESKDSSRMDKDTSSAFPTTKITFPNFDPDALFDCAKSHAAASAIWSRAYPNFCPRCALSCDGQCGVCIHGSHMCACTICNPQFAHCGAAVHGNERR